MSISTFLAERRSQSAVELNRLARAITQTQANFRAHPRASHIRTQGQTVILRSTVSTSVTPERCGVVSTLKRIKTGQMLTPTWITAREQKRNQQCDYTRHSYSSCPRVASPRIGFRCHTLQKLLSIAAVPAVVNESCPSAVRRLCSWMRDQFPGAIS